MFPAYDAAAAGLGEAAERDASGKHLGSWQSLRGVLLNRFTGELLPLSSFLLCGPEPEGLEDV